MNPRPHHGFDVDLDAATLIEDPHHPRQRAMRALVEAEQARLASAPPSGDPTRLGSLVPPEQPAHALVPVHRDNDFRGYPDDLDTVHDFEELPLPAHDDARGPTARAASAAGEWEWLEVEEHPDSAPMVRAVSDESLARAACAPANPIRSTHPPPGPERSVVVQQVSPFGSDARVVAKPKPPSRPAIPPQGETLPYGVAPGAPARVKVAPVPEQPAWASDRTSAEVPGAFVDPRAQVVAVGGDVRPQRFIPTVIQPLPTREAPRPEARPRRLPVRGVVSAAAAGVAALFNGMA